jgi:hypothetical protein
MNLSLVVIAIAIFAFAIWYSTIKWIKAGKPVSLSFEWPTIRNLLVLVFASFILSIAVYQLMIYSASVQVSMLAGVSIGIIIISITVLRELTKQSLSARD